MTARLRADLVVGGLWRGALVDVGGAAWPVVHVDQYGEGWVSVVTLDGILDMRPREAMLVLDDPLGLGLAGLAVRVAQRLGPEPAGWPGDEAADDAMYPPDHLPADWLVRTVGVRPLTWVQSMTADEVAMLSTYLALTDRLCAAVGLELAPGEVARWESRPTLVEGRAEWFLAAGGQVRTFAAPDDWQAALEAALREVTRAP